MDVVGILLLHVQSLQLPYTLLLSSAHFRVAFFDNYNIRQSVFVTVIKVFQLLDRHLSQIVAKHCVVEIDEFSQVGVHNEGAIRFAEL